MLTKSEGLLRVSGRGTTIHVKFKDQLLKPIFRVFEVVSPSSRSGRRTSILVK